MEIQQDPQVYLCDSLINYKPAHVLRRRLRAAGMTPVPEQWDAHRVAVEGEEAWGIIRTRQTSEVETDVLGCQALICGYPNWTATGRRTWFELWTAVEAKIPIIVARYASGTEQPELRRLLTNAIWIDTKRRHEEGLREILEAVRLLVLPPVMSLVLDEPKRIILVDSRRYWDGLIRTVSTDARLLRHVSPRKFEEIVASLIERDGFRVELTPSSNDGGRDILAYHDHALGTNLFLVECKRYAPGNPVGAQIVRQLFGVLEDEDATGAAIVTTSSFTREAIAFADRNSRKLALRDFDYLSTWVRALRASDGRRPSVLGPAS